MTNPPSDAALMKKTRLSKRKAVLEAAATKAAEDELLAARIQAEIEAVADRRLAAAEAEAARTKMAAEALISDASKCRRVDVASSSQVVDASDNDVLETGNVEPQEDIVQSPVVVVDRVRRRRLTRKAPAVDSTQAFGVSVHNIRLNTCMEALPMQHDVFNAIDSFVSKVFFSWVIFS